MLENKVDFIFFYALKFDLCAFLLKPRGDGFLLKFIITVLILYSNPIYDFFENINNHIILKN